MQVLTSGSRVHLTATEAFLLVILANVAVIEKLRAASAPIKPLTGRFLAGKRMKLRP